MTERTTRHSLQVATELYRFIEDKVLPGTGVASDAFWSGFDAIVADLAPKNFALLVERDSLQTQLDVWHTANPGAGRGPEPEQHHQRQGDSPDRGFKHRRPNL